MTTDVLVIGGGIAGLSAGARLSEDAHVAVLEAESHIGYHASGRSAALFEEHYGSPSTLVLNTASAAYHRTANGGYLSPRGLMVLGRADEEEALVADVTSMGLDRISPSEAVAFVPVLNLENLAYAGYHDAAYDIDTDRMLQDFARQIRGNGGSVLIDQKVNAIARTDGLWHVTCGSQTHKAKTLVNAAGAWADTIAALAGVQPIGIVPHRRSMARIPAPGGHDPSDWPMFFGVGESWYAKADAGALLVSPADEDPVEPHDAWAEDMTLAEGLARYEAFVTEPVTRLLSSWAGLRSFSPDRALVLGRDREQPEFVWCAGQGGYGFQSAPAASQLLADLVAGRPAQIDMATVAALSPTRFT